MVHRECYGLSPSTTITASSRKGKRKAKVKAEIEDGDLGRVDVYGNGGWLCDRCSHEDPDVVRCVLCPVLDGALRQVDMDVPCFAHMVCALWLKDVEFGDEET